METFATTAPTVAETFPEVTETVAETTVETMPETFVETTAATEPTVVIEETEVVETYDYVATLVQIEENTAVSAEFSGWIAGFSLFNVVVILCFFAYKFLRIFF